jgi:hypothetical protein
VSLLVLRLRIPWADKEDAMTHTAARVAAAALLAVALLAGPATALAQEPAAPAVSPAGTPDRPRLEFGVGVSNLFALGTTPTSDFMLDGRVGLKLSRRWSLEGLVHVAPPDDSGFTGYYRVQAVYRIGQASLQPFLAVGGAGEMNYYKWRDFSARDSAGNVLWTQTAGSDFSGTAPYYPVVTVGLQKALGSRIAIRVELTMTGGVNDNGIAPAFMPAVSVSIPIGRYGTVR